MKIRYSTRLVILAGRFALKIPLSLRGWKQGRNEARVWRAHKGHCLLVPIIWSLGGIVCMRRVEEAPFLPTELISLMKGTVAALDCADCDLHRVENWGQYKGHFILLDYGISADVAAMYKKK